MTDINLADPGVFYMAGFESPSHYRIARDNIPVDQFFLDAIFPGICYAACITIIYNSCIYALHGFVYK